MVVSLSRTATCENRFALPSNEGIGIDLGMKDLAICSDGHKYQNINKTQKVKKLEKRKCRLQRSISRRYGKNKKGENYCKTSNLIKSEQEPSFICIEDLYGYVSSELVGMKYKRL
uniref:hypothetical protein n=1 Tax=Velocimicrobium porci TaxID=2606634 RepID=UPI002F3F1258